MNLIKKLTAPVLFILLFSLELSAQYKLTDKLPADPNVKIGKLANGLTYYIRKNIKPEKKVELRLDVGLHILWSIWVLTALKIFPKMNSLTFFRKAV
jgi:dolichol kinase